MNDADREILDHFIRTREKTLDLARRVPENLLDRTADGEEHTLAGLFGHIANGVDWWMNFVMDDGRGWQPADDTVDRDGVIRALAASRDRLVEFFEAEDGAPMGRTFTITDPDTNTTDSYVGRNRVLYLADHEVHHRGKIVLALRQWDFTDIPFLPF